jgi:hypothetical protein
MGAVVITLCVVGLVVLVVATLLVRGGRVPDGPENPLLDRARILVQEQNQRWPDRDGEAKRHQCYARLVKEFPTRAKREIARAIEDAL